MFDFPSSPAVDQIYTAHGVTYKFNGVGWLSTGLTIITASDAAPSAPIDNSLWYETDTSILWLRYNDSNSTQWVQISGPPVPSSNLFLPLSGGTLSGFLNIAPSGDAQLDLRKASATNYNILWGKTGTTARWAITLGDNTAESGGNAGSNFNITAWSDAGGLITTPLQIARSTGVVTINNNLQVSAATAQLELRKSASGQACNIFGMLGSTARWVIVPGGNGAETGGNTGSDFLIARYTDAGALIDLPFSIARSTGKSTFSAAPDISNGASQGFNGYVRLFNGLILQWGYVGGAGGAQSINVTFPIAFPTATLSYVATMDGDPGAGNSLSCSAAGSTASGFTIYPRYANNGGYVGPATQGIHWMAIGY